MEAGKRGDASVASLRLQWLRLNALTQGAGFMLAPTWNTMLVGSVTVLIVCCYAIIRAVVNRSPLAHIMGFGAFVLVHFATILFSFDIGQRVQTMSKKFLETLINLDKTKIDKESYFQVKLFLSAINMSQSGFEVARFYTVNRSLSTSVLKNVATYLIVLGQVKLNISFTPILTNYNETLDTSTQKI